VALAVNNRLDHGPSKSGMRPKSTLLLLAANPSGKVPAIRDGEVAMGESTAIMLYLTQKHGPTPLALQPEHAQYADYLQFLVFGEASRRPSSIQCC
jgi:glutathione S-transferase